MKRFILDGVGGIAENLIAAAIGGGLATGWRLIRKRTSSKDVRAMWAPFLTEPSCIVEGILSPRLLCESFPDSVSPRHRDVALSLLPDLERYVGEQEASGLMGKGDHEAIVRIQAGLARVGLRATLPVRSDHELGEHKLDNLIVVGGPDVNVVTKDLLTRLRCGLAISRGEHDRNVVEDLRHGIHYSTKYDNSRLQDYGIIVKAPSPYQSGRVVVIVAGAYGHGCIAAGHLAVTAVKELSDYGRRYSRGFECVVSHRRTGETSSPIEENSILFAREIQSS